MIPVLACQLLPQKQKKKKKKKKRAQGQASQKFFKRNFLLSNDVAAFAV
jgi:hypothetical protein